MPTEDKLRKTIADICARPKNVELQEIAKILEHIGWRRRQTKHCHLFTSPSGDVITLNEHNNGSRHLPAYCVRDFARIMVLLDLLD